LEYIYKALDVEILYSVSEGKGLPFNVFSLNAFGGWMQIPYGYATFLIAQLLVYNEADN